MKLKFPHLHLQSVDSTNSFAQEYITKITPPEGFFIVSDFQTAGKGQYGRKWEGNPGENIFISFIYQPNFILAGSIFQLHQWISISLVRVIKTTTGIVVKIKWPNDIYYMDKKLGGILIENIWRGEVLKWSIIGIGLNINQINFSSDLQATSLALMTGSRFSIEDIIEALCIEIQKQYENIRNQNNSELESQYNDFLYLKGSKNTFRNEKNEIFDGIILSVNAAGEILIQTETGIVSFGFGNLEYLR